MQVLLPSEIYILLSIGRQREGSLFTHTGVRRKVDDSLFDYFFKLTTTNNRNDTELIELQTAFLHQRLFVVCIFTIPCVAV
jgi:hypothetical protein